MERWIFQGIYQDDFSEFGLHSNPQCFSARNRVYWNGAFTVADPSATSSFLLDNSVCGGGSFLAEIQHQVYVCGKTINLLRLCQPNHHLCDTMVLKRPRIRLLVSPIEQAQLQRECQDFVVSMSKVAEEKTRSLNQIRQEKEQKRKEILKIAQEKHKENMARLNEERRQLREEDDRRKKKVLDDFKEQAKIAKEKKEAEKKKQLEEDKMYEDMANKKDEEEIKREEAVKREIEEKYRRLTEEAKDRERRAEWRGKRMDLREERFSFWQRENKKIQEELRQLDTLKEEEEEEEGKPKWTRARVVEDAMRNITLVLEDDEGNVVGEGVVNTTDEVLTAGLRDRMMLEGFNSLPKWAQARLSEQVLPGQTAEDVDSGRHPPVVRRNRSASQPKRKRPESFPERDFNKRVEVEQGLMGPPASTAGGLQHNVRKSRSNLSLMSVGTESEGCEESLAAALEKDHDAVVRRRRPRELKTVEGRKRPTSKSIEEVLYPARFSQHGGSASESETTPVTPSRTEFNLLPSLPVQPYPKSFSGLGGPNVESLVSILCRREGKSLTDEPEQTVDKQAFAPLTLLMENSILIPLRAQLKVANAAILNCMLVDFGLMDHLKAIRNYLLFHDGEFANQVNKITSKHYY